jgi:hypothetical protein
MTEEEFRRLQGYYYAMQQVLSSIPSTNVTEVVDKGSYDIIKMEVEQIETAFPGILPPFNEENFFAHVGHRGHSAWYRLHALRLYVGAAVGRLKGATEVFDTAPVTQKRNFAYINDAEVRAIIMRDYDELQRAYVTNCWKSVIIVCGGSIEAILLDLLKHNETLAKSATAAPQQNDLMRWNLSHLIEVAVELKLVGKGIGTLSHSIREYRNLIHPGVEVRNCLSFGHEEARIAMEVLHLLDRELTPE